jgi:hypothetical protein
MGIHAFDAERRRRVGHHDRRRELRDAVIGAPTVRAAILRCTIAIAIATLTLATASRSSAQGLAEDIPVVGGTAATARALGIDVVPDRPRFLAELVRVIYDAQEGKNVEIDAKLARLATHRQVIERFQSTLQALQAETIVISLAMSPVKGERGRLRDFLDLVGLKLRDKNRTLTVVVSDEKRAVERIKLLSNLGIDVAKLAAQLNGGETVRVELATETIPVPLSAKLWSDVIFGRPTPPGQLFAEILANRRAALLALGLSALDDDTLRYFTTHANVLADLYEHGAAAFAAFGDALRIRGTRVVPNGGPDGVLVWEAVLGAPVAQPELFVRALFSAGHGRVALLYQTLAHLDLPHVRFALGSWMAEPAARIDQFKELIAAENARAEWDVEFRPFVRPVYDPSFMLARMRVQNTGAPARPASRAFWQHVFAGSDLPDDPSRLLRNQEEDGPIHAGWIARYLTDDPRARREHGDQIVFGQRVFAAAPDSDLPDALIALRAVTRFRMLMLALDRMGVRSATTYAAAARQAARLSALNGQRGFTALAQFQAALALVGRLVRVHSLPPATASTLVDALVAVPLNDEGAYAGGISRWVEGRLLPALTTPPIDDVDARLVASLAGATDAEPVLKKVDWEGRPYLVDLVSYEQRRITRTRDKMGAPSIRLALDIGHLAARLAPPSVTVPVAREALGELRKIAAALPPKDKKNSVHPPGIEPGRSPADSIEKAVDLLTRINGSNLPLVTQVVAPLFAVSEEVLADALLSLTYALDLGNPDGTTLMGGNVSRRHDFGFVNREGDKRERVAWSTPTRAIAAGVPWHVAGSALGLDTALSALALRRIDSGEIPAAPVLLMPDRETFTKTLAWMNPFDLTDENRDAVVAAIARGRSRVEALARDANGWDEAADEIRMDGWRRRAGRWAIAHDAALVPSFFSLIELLYLGAPPPDLALNTWGMARDASDACVCIDAPTPGHDAIVVGRPQLGLIAAEVADINLHVAEQLRARGLPASLTPGVLAGAILDYIEQVRPAHPADWLTLVRAAQAIPDDRLDDYVAALTTDGPLAPERAPSGPEGRQK